MKILNTKTLIALGIAALSFTNASRLGSQKPKDQKKSLPEDAKKPDSTIEGGDQTSTQSPTTATSSSNNASSNSGCTKLKSDSNERLKKNQSCAYDEECNSCSCPIPKLGHYQKCK